MTLQTATKTITADDFQDEAENFFTIKTKITHDLVLREILDTLQQIDFDAEAKLGPTEKLSQKHLVVLTIREVLRSANLLNCGLCRQQDFIYSYNGEFWKLLDREELKIFLGEAAEKLGVRKITATYFKFKDELYKQFLAAAHLPKPEKANNAVLINFQNKTGEITKDGLKLRPFSRADFLTYQLNFAYDKDATCERWQSFLDEVLPEKDKVGNVIDEGKSRQKVLAEYIAYIFTSLKLEKTLILFGSGANGKSVFFEVIYALLGKNNISNFSLESLGDQYYRAMLANKILNYSSEISNRLQAEKFKQLTSGEPIEARLPYGQPMTLTNYAKLAFNTNELPRDVEHTKAFFRRFLIIPFDVTIPEEKQNPNLANEIIETELAGVFNWILEGLNRLLQHGKFSKCDAAQKALETYRKESDSVAMFIEDERYEKSSNYSVVKTIYQNYRSYCLDNGYKPLGRNNFTKRLEANGVVTDRLSMGLVAYIQQ
ncbi:MAG: phage/plasmid primase, P4 family [Acidobacteria bacterium]|nr:phage/plasmid primase, P4 family [Acidobacteriota bacterium]MCA1638782.1 phage/plasmid primase, P4 family [Acidobacteriota bacterium]